MANKRNNNSKFKGAYRHVFKKRKLPACLMKKNDHTNNKEPIVSTKIEGSRIINMNKLGQYTEELNAHSSHCKGAIN